MVGLLDHQTCLIMSRHYKNTCGTIAKKCLFELYLLLDMLYGLGANHKWRHSNFPILTPSLPSHFIHALYKHFVTSVSL